MRYPQSFFQIEKLRPDLKLGMFKGSLDDLLKLREANRKQNRPLNSSFPYYPEEKDLIEKMYSEGKSVGEIIDFFQRPESGIRKILGANLVKDLKRVKTVSRADLFFESILYGADPVTGEMLENESPWRHPKIISDIKSYIDDKKNTGTKLKNTENNGGWRFLDIKEWIKTNYDEVDLVIIQQGHYFAALHEDAVLCAEEFGLEPYRIYETSVLQAGFPVTAIEKYVGLFESRDLNFVVVEQTGDKHSNGRMVRRITFPETLREGFDF